MQPKRAALLALVCAMLRAVDVHGHEGDPPAPGESGEPEVITIIDSIPTEEASEERITARELAARPRRTPGELLSSAPGLFVGQHAGGGKADQLFLRGFDADHGTDVAIFVDGVPVNVVSHAHGQGYADLHFVIPELVSHIHVTRGPSRAEVGDFGTAGAISLQTMRRVEPFVSVEGGSFATLRLAGATGGSHGPLDGWLAAELHTSDGPFDAPQELRRTNLHGKVTLDLGERTLLTLNAQSYAAGWDASGQIPLREVEAGRLSRFGAIDSSEGGVSARDGVILSLLGHPGDGRDDLEARLYWTRYRLDLFSNFTFALEDPARGDGIEQVDARTTTGFAVEHRRAREVYGVNLATRLGVQGRSDDAQVALHHQQARLRLETRNAARVEQSDLAAYGEVTFSQDDDWRLTLGGRADLFVVTIDEADGSAQNGSAKRAIANPKLRAEFEPGAVSGARVVGFVTGGGGFHSSDARNFVAAGGGASALPRAWGADFGVRARDDRGRWEGTVTGWGLWLDHELVWVGDGGGVDVRGATRRLGVEGAVRAAILPWVAAEVEATWSHARFANGDHVPLAPTLTLVGMLTARHASGLTASLRVRHVSDRPAEETGRATAEGYTVGDLLASWRRGAWTVEVDVDNLWDAEWREAQFWFESRLPDEVAPVEDIHFTPGVPLSARASVTYTF